MADKDTKKSVEETENYGDMLAEIFKGNDWQFGVKKGEDATIFTLPMSAKNCPGFNITLSISDIGDAKLRCYLAEGTDKTKRGKILEVLNDLNGRYRYMTLSLDSDGDILAAYDFNILSRDIDAVKLSACSMIVLFVKVADNCVPPIMKAVWSDD